MADNFYGPEDMAEYYRMTKPNILTDGLYVVRDGNLAKMETKYILPKGATVCWMGGNPTNGDHIRAMTDEELVFFLWWFADGSGKTKDQWRDWLKQEVSDA